MENIRDLNQAWDLYYHVFRRISRQLPQLTSLELQYVSPKLLACKDLELAVPGSYIPGQELISIKSIHANLQVRLFTTKCVLEIRIVTRVTLISGHHIETTTA